MNTSPGSQKSGGSNGDGWLRGIFLGRVAVELRVVGLVLLLLAAVLEVRSPTITLEATFRPLSLGSRLEPQGLIPGLRSQTTGEIFERIDWTEQDHQERQSVAPGEVLEGFLTIEASGLHAIGIESDRPVRLSLGRFTLVDHPGSSSPLLIARSVRLEPGVYPVALHLGPGEPHRRLGLIWQPPAGGLSLVPGDLLEHADSHPVDDGGSAVSEIASSPLAVATVELPLRHPMVLSNPVLFNWDHARLGTPAFPPLYVIEYRGSSSAPLESFRADITGSGRIELPQNPDESQSGDTDQPHEIRFRQFPQGGEKDWVGVLVPEGEALTAPVDSRWIHRTGWVALLGGFLLLLSGRPRWRVPSLREVRRGGVTLALLLGFLLRLQDHDLVPRPFETLDEINHLWSGQRLVEGFSPLGWSDHKAYGERPLTFYHGYALRIADPYLDWPPLMSALVGVFLEGFSDRSAPDFPLEDARYLPILLAVFSIWLLYRLSRQIVGGTLVPLLATFTYATLPLAVALSRLVKEESLLTVFVLGGLHAALRSMETGSTRHRRWMFLVVFGAVLVKLSGLSLAVLLVLILVRQRRPWDAITVSGLALLALATYPAWGAIWDAELLFAVQQEMAGKPLDPSMLVSLVTRIGWVERPFGIGWMLWFFLAAFAGATSRDRRLEPATLLILLYCGFIAMTVWFPFGWYMLPVLPLLCLLSTVVLARQVEKPEPFILFCFIGLVLVPALSYRLGTDAASMRALVRAAFVLGLLMPLACTIWSTRFLMWGSRFTVWALLIAALILQAVGDINRGF